MLEYLGRKAFYWKNKNKYNYLFLSNGDTNFNLCDKIIEFFSNYKYEFIKLVF